MKWLLPLLVLTMSCHYRFQDPNHLYSDQDSTPITIPYIRGDEGGKLNEALVLALADSPSFEYQQEGGTLRLEVRILNDTAKTIGYRYDRKPTTGKLRPNILSTENRRTIEVEVSVIDTQTEKVIIGPVKIKESADYDFVESSSIHDLTFTPPGGSPQTAIQFSLGQLDTVEGASDDSVVPLYDRLARKITAGLENLYPQK